MNIVLLEGLAVPQKTIEELAASLKEQGHTFTAWLDGKWDPETLIQRAKDADILMVANSPLPAQVVQACSRLKMISVAFTGVDHIPMEVCRQRGVLVCNCAGYSTTAVAELHDDDSFREIAQWIAGAKRYYIQCFIDRDSVLRTGLHAPDKAQLERWADIVRPLIPSVELRGV